MQIQKTQVALRPVLTLGTDKLCLHRTILVILLPLYFLLSNCFSSNLCIQLVLFLINGHYHEVSTHEYWSKKSLPPRIILTGMFVIRYRMERIPSIGKTRNILLWHLYHNVWSTPGFVGLSSTTMSMRRWQLLSPNSSSDFKSRQHSIPVRVKVRDPVFTLSFILFCREYTVV